MKTELLVQDRGAAKGRRILTDFFSKIYSVGNALDLGCGGGGGVDLINLRESHPRAQLYGIDTREVDDERKKEFSQIGIKVLKNDIERDQLPFEKESLDVVMSNQVLEHTKELFWIMHETSRVLKNEGHLIIGVPNLASLHNRLLLLFGLQPSTIKNFSAHIRGFTKQDILSLLNKPFYGGYKLIDFKGSGFYPFPVAIADPLSSIFPAMSVRIYLLLQKARKYHKEFLEYPVSQKLSTNFYLGQNGRNI